MKTPKFLSVTPSNRKDKKYLAVFYDGNKNKIKSVHFGGKNYSDYTIHKDPKRKQRYISRHKSNENWTKPMNAGSLSRWILWNKKTFKQSIDDYMKKFKMSRL